jgi:hypothetical protein
MWVQSIKVRPVYVERISIFVSIDGAYQFFLPVSQRRNPESEINSTEFYILLTVHPETIVDFQPT